MLRVYGRCDVEFAAIRARALAVRALYAAHEERRYGRSWTLEELVLGLVGDVGDLAKLVQAREGVRDIGNEGAHAQTVAFDRK